MAAGDAVGTTIEFSPPGSFQAVTGMVGGGPFHLKAGEWTDDTSMALCLAESLVERNGFDPADQMRRYVDWYRNGHLSSNDVCFDIGNTVKAALHKFEQTGKPYCGSTDPNTAGNGSLMRLTPVPLYFAGNPQAAIAMAADSSRTTHGAPVAVDGCRYLAAVIVGALSGASKEELLSDHYSPVPGVWEKQPLVPEIAEIARGSYKGRNPPFIKGTGYAAKSLEAALWAFAESSDFRQGCLLAVNLGDDSDTTAAIYGQLAGAFYGSDAIPADWLSKLAKREMIVEFADKLLAASSLRNSEKAKFWRKATAVEQNLASDYKDILAATKRHLPRWVGEARQRGDKGVFLMRISRSDWERPEGEPMRHIECKPEWLKGTAKALSDHCMLVGLKPNIVRVAYEFDLYATWD
jgi:ADP-ribosylglycohydrolase